MNFEGYVKNLIHDDGDLETYASMDTVYFSEALSEVEEALDKSGRFDKQSNKTSCMALRFLAHLKIAASSQTGGENLTQTEIKEMLTNARKAQFNLEQSIKALLPVGFEPEMVLFVVEGLLTKLEEAHLAKGGRTAKKHKKVTANQVISLLYINFHMKYSHTLSNETLSVLASLLLERDVSKANVRKIVSRVLEMGRMNTEEMKLINKSGV